MEADNLLGCKSIGLIYEADSIAGGPEARAVICVEAGDIVINIQSNGRR